MSTAFRLAIPCAAALALLPGCEERVCGAHGVRVTDFRSGLSDEGAGRELQGCGIHCVDLAGNVFRRGDWDQAIASIPADAGRVNVYDNYNHREIFCGDAGQAYWSSEEDRTVWTAYANETSSDFTYGRYRDGEAICVAQDGHANLDEYLIWRAHTPFPAAPKQLWELDGAGAWELADGSMWWIGDSLFELGGPVLEPGERAENVTYQYIGPESMALWIATDAGEIVRLDNHREVTRPSAISTEDPSAEIEAWVVGRGHRSWVIDTDGCAWIGNDLESLRQTGCETPTEFAITRTRLRAEESEAHAGGGEVVTTIYDSVTLEDSSTAELFYSAFFAKCAGYSPLYP